MAYLGNQVATASGNITTQNLVPAGTATANSAVEIVLNGATTLGIQTTGTYTGALTLQITLNGTSWISMAGTPLLNLGTGGYGSTITTGTQNIFQADVAGALRARITGLAAMTGTATVTLIAIQSAAMVALDAAIPTGANQIGSITQGGTWTVGISAASAAGLLKAEDAVHASGDAGVMSLGVQQATPAALGAAGDYEPFTVGPDGRMMVDNAYSKTTSSGVLQFRTTSLVATAQAVKASAGNLYGMTIINSNTSAVFVKFYNTAQGSTTVGTTAVVYTYGVPAGVSGNPGMLVITPDVMPLFNFSTAITVSATGLMADNDTTAVTASTVMAQIQYM